LNAPSPEFQFPINQKDLYSDLYSGMNRFIDKIKIYNKKSILLEVSTQIVHDLQVPISIIRNELKRGIEFDKRAAQNALERMEQISSSLLNKKTFNFLNLESFIKETYTLSEHLSLKLETKIEIEKLPALRLSELDLYRIISNLLKNSKEASSTSVSLELLIENSFLKVSLRDNGTGIKNNLIKEVRKKKFTTKDTGNGLGLSFINETLQQVGGTLILQNAQPAGLLVELKIPIQFFQNKGKIILVDDDKYMGVSWAQAARREGHDFYYFSSSIDLMNEIINFRKNDIFFIDVSLNDEDGIKLAKQIFERGYNNIYLATGHHLSFDDIPHFIKGSISKEYPINLLESNKSV
jgi:hypothetical protein